MRINDDLDRQLQGAFDQARPTGHEDVRGLRERTVAKAYGIRRRRRIGTTLVSTVATAAMVGGVANLAAGGWLGVGTGSTGVSPAGQLSFAPAVEEEPFRAVTPRDLSAVIPRQESLPEGVVYDGPATEHSSAGPAASLVQVCDSSDDAVMAGMDAAPAPVAHASRDGYEINNGEVERTVFVTVTGWAPGTGAQRFADLQNNTLACRFVTPHERLPWTGRDLASSWLSVHRNGIFTSYLASQRVGDVIVSVVVDRTTLQGEAQGKDEVAAKQDAIRLADEIIANLKASDLSAAKGL